MPIGVDFWYRDVNELLGVIINKYPDKLLWDYDPNNGVIAHPFNTKGAKIFARRRDELTDQRGRPRGSIKMLAPVSVIDGYKQYRRRDSEVVGIYLSLANLIESALDSSDHIYLVSVLPSGVDLFEAVRTILVQPLAALQKGLTFSYKSDEIVEVCGSLFALLGDHKGLAELAGIVSASSRCPSRYSYAWKDQLAQTEATESKPWPPKREPQEARQAIDRLTNSIEKGEDVEGWW